MPKMIGRYYYRREATEFQRMEKVWERYACRQLLARRSMYVFNNDRIGELEDLWVQEPENRKTAQLGSNWGYYVGFDAIKGHYEKFAAADKDYCYHMPNGTNIIHIAADDQTAFCLIYSLASKSCETDHGVHGYDLCYRIWFDLKKENGEWKIWHVLEGNDFTNEHGVSIAGRPAEALEGVEHPYNPAQGEFGEPNFPVVAYDSRLGWYRFPRIPDAHDSYSLDMSCSLEACLKFKAGMQAEHDVEALYNKLGGAK